MTLPRRLPRAFFLPLLLLLAACAAPPRTAAPAPSSANTSRPSAAQANDPMRKVEPALVAIAATTPPTPPYLAPADFDLLAHLPPPPVNDSPLTRAEIELVLTLQHEATPAALARARSEEDMTWTIYADVLGPGYNAAALPRTFAFLKAATADASTIYNAAKDRHQRPRPPAIDRRVNPVDAVPTSFSYPSGHGTRSMLWATLLSECLPERREALRARAAAIAYSRVVLGVHFPSDIVAGMATGELLGAAIIASPKAHADLEAVRAELREAFKPAPSTR